MNPEGSSLIWVHIDWYSGYQEDKNCREWREKVNMEFENNIVRTNFLNKKKQ